jgi:OPA family glycerol-3-phosphate transporter-like MFS transporter 1/2
VDVSSEDAAYMSTLFDMGGIAGGILAGVVSDYTGRSASTCAVMLIAAIPTVS